MRASITKKPFACAVLIRGSAGVVVVFGAVSVDAVAIVGGDRW